MTKQQIEKLILRFEKLDGYKKQIISFIKLMGKDMAVTL